MFQHAFANFLGMGGLQLGRSDLARQRLAFQTDRALIGAPGEAQQSEGANQEERASEPRRRQPGSQQISVFHSFIHS